MRYSITDLAKILGCTTSAIGYSSQKDLYNEVRFDISNARLIGDANKVQNIMYAIWNAYEVARNI